MYDMQRYGSPQDRPGTEPEEATISISDVANVLRRRRATFLIVTSLCLAAGIVYLVVTPHTWQATSQIVLLQRPIIQTASGTQYTEPVANIANEYTLIQSPGMVQRTAAWIKNATLGKPIFTDDELGDLSLADDINVTNDRDTNVLTVEALGKSPAKAAFLANAYCQSFVAWDRELAQQDVDRSIEQLSHQVEEARGNLTKAQQAEAGFRTAHGFVDIPAEERSLVEQQGNRILAVADLDAKVAQSNATLSALKGQLNEANKAIADGGGLRDDSQIQQLQSQYTLALIALEDAKQKYTSAYPGQLQPLQASVDSLRARIKAAVTSTASNKNSSLQAQAGLLLQYQQAQVAVATSTAEYKAAVAEQAEITQKIASMPAIDRSYASLAQALTVATTIYQSVESSYADAQIRKSKMNGNVQVTQEAVVGDLPVKPRPVLTIAVSLVAGIFASILLAIWREQTDRRIFSTNQIITRLPGRILGVLPEMPRNVAKQLAHGNTTPQSIALFSMVRANLDVTQRYANLSDAQFRMILVTSAAPGEGKSVASLHLATLNAWSGKQVLIVDANMYNPSMSKRYSSENKIGLSDVLEGNANIHDVIFQTDDQNLSVMSAGTPVSDPTRLLSTPRLAQLMHDLRGVADVIIIDSPACARLADTMLIAPFVDCIAHVIGLGIVKDKELDDSISFLASAGKTVVHIANRLPTGASASSNPYGNRGGIRGKKRHDAASQLRSLPVGSPVSSFKGGSDTQE